MICQNIYWPGIRYAVRKEVTNCDTFQHTKPSNIKYGKLPVKEPDKKPWKKLFVDVIRSDLIKKNNQKEYLNIEAVTMIYHVTGWFEVTQYNNKRVMEIDNLVEINWVSRYPRPMDITYDQGK